MRISAPAMCWHRTGQGLGRNLSHLSFVNNIHLHKVAIFTSHCILVAHLDNVKSQRTTLLVWPEDTAVTLYACKIGSQCIGGGYSTKATIWDR